MSKQIIYLFNITCVWWKHDKTFVSFGESPVSFIFGISWADQYDPIKKHDEMNLLVDQ